MPIKANEIIIEETQHWLESVVIEFNFCPFAKRELINNRIRFAVCDTDDIATTLETLITECEYLDTHSATETTLLIMPSAFSQFENYLNMLELAQTLLETQNYEGIYQLASFHPNYCFDDSDNDDPANYTNRSPYPMLHLIREASLELALESYEQPELIPENNIKIARKTGLKKLQTILQSCYQTKN